MKFGIKCGPMTREYLSGAAKRLSQAHLVELEITEQDGGLLLVPCVGYPSAEAAVEAIAGVRQALRKDLGGREEIVVQLNPEEEFISLERAYIRLDGRFAELNERHMRLERDNRRRLDPFLLEQHPAFGGKI